MRYHSPMDIALTAIGLICAGLIIGIFSGLLGIGGGAVMIPLFRLVFGLDAFVATATSLFTMIFTSLSGAISHVRNKTCYPQLGLALGVGGALTSPLGVQLSAHSPAWAIMLVAALIIFYSSYTMLRKALKIPKTGRTAAHPASGSQKEVVAETANSAAQNGPAPANDKPTSPQSETDEFELSRRTLVYGFFIGMVAGLFAGYVGIGGGFLMVPLMIGWLHVPMKKASGTSIVAIIILAIPGVISQILLGHINFMHGILMAVGSIPGAALGARMIKYVNERQLRFLFAGFLFVAGALLILNELGIL